MFYGCQNFNQPLDSWNVGQVTSMSYMFYRCLSFNQSLNSWNVGQVTYMSYMFHGCESLMEKPISLALEHVNDMYTGCNFDKSLDFVLK